MIQRVSTEMMAPGGLATEGRVSESYAKKLRDDLDAARAAQAQAEKALAIIQESGLAGRLLVEEALKIVAKFEVGA